MPCIHQDDADLVQSPLAECRYQRLDQHFVHESPTKQINQLVLVTAITEESRRNFISDNVGKGGGRCDKNGWLTKKCKQCK